METTINKKECTKRWKLEHKEEEQAYHKNYYENNKDYFRDYHKIYYLEHKEHMLATAKRWREENKGDFIYEYINEEKEIIYIGSTARCFIERTSFHLNGHSNLELTAEEMVFELGLDEIRFQNYKEYNFSRDDLFFIESYLKENTKEILKTNAVHYNEGNLTRNKEELIDIMTKTEWETFDKLDKYLN